MNRHGTVVQWRNAGLLLTGPSGSGKSTLALQLIERGASLVADDQVLLSRQGGLWMARCPQPLQGKLHLRDKGMLAMASTQETALHLMACSAQPAPPLSRPPKLGLPVITLNFLDKNAVSTIEAALLGLTGAP